MSHYEYFLIFLSLVFCGYASYTDLKTQKIRNFCSLGLLYVGTLSQLMGWYLGRTTPLEISGLFFGGGLIAFGLYWFGVFSPGDCKLFWGLCLIFPSSLFESLIGTLGFPPSVLILNIIVPYAIGILGYLIFKFVSMRNKLKLLRYLLRSNFQKSVLLDGFFGVLLLVGTVSVFTYLMQRFGWGLDPFMSFIFVLVSFILIQKIAVYGAENTSVLRCDGFYMYWVGSSSDPISTDIPFEFCIYVGTVFRCLRYCEAANFQCGEYNIEQCC